MPKDLDTVFSKALRLADGRYRASLSLFVEGEPIGPWTYEGRRSDDPNDVVNHEDRRELRGMEVMAAWLGFYDTREQNTLASFVKHEPGGYVRHYLIDVGNVFGSIWDPPALGRRITHAYYLDIPYLLEDSSPSGSRSVRGTTPALGRRGRPSAISTSSISIPTGSAPAIRTRRSCAGASGTRRGWRASSRATPTPT